MKHIFILLTLICRYSAQNQSSICIQPTNPPFIPQGFMPFGGVSGDFDNDGNIDLITHTPSMPGISRFFGTGVGTFSVSSLFPINGGQDGILLSNDFNNDGNKDLMLLQKKSTPVYPQAVDSMLIFLNTGSGSFVRAFGYSLPASPSGAIMGKFNLDATFDVAINFGTQTYFMVYHGIGNGSFGLSMQYATSFVGLGMLFFDLTNDGRDDIVRNNQVFKGLANGTFSVNPIIMQLNGLASNTINLNNDNLPDLICLSGASILLYVNNGNYTFNQIQAIAMPKNFRSIAKIDLDSDGKGDFVVGSNQQVDFYAKTSSNYQSVSSYTFNFGLAWPWGIITDDLNNDLREDAIVFCDNTPGPFIFLNCNSKDVGINSESVIEATLYPNPSEGFQKLILPQDYSFESLSISLTNLVGETYLPKFHRLSNNSVHIDLREFSNGIYYLQLLNSDSKQTFGKKILLTKNEN